MGVLATPGKRKFSFSPPEPSPSDEGTASTARKKQCQVRQVDNSELNAEPRPRASTITALGSAGCKQRRKRRQRNNSLPVEDPKQSTLSMYWKKDGGDNGDLSLLPSSALILASPGLRWSLILIFIKKALRTQARTE